MEPLGVMAVTADTNQETLVPGDLMATSAIRDDPRAENGKEPTERHVEGRSLGTIGAAQHRIDLVPGARPARSQPHRAGPLQRDIVDGEVKRMQDARVIRPSMSEWGAPGFILRKKDKTPRLYIDYRRLNFVTKKDSYLWQNWPQGGGRAPHTGSGRQLV